jgi:hypothetical protein
MPALPLPRQFARVLFPDLDLGDVRRDRRFAAVVDTLAAGTGPSLPALFPRTADYDACLRLFDSPQATHANILSAHQLPVLDRLESVTTPVLLIHDATHLDFSGHTTLQRDNGPIGNGAGRGWIAHQTIAVDPADRTVYGLVCQILHTRPESTKGEKVAVRRARKDRETRLWIEALNQIGPAPAHATWIDVMDRGADTFEVLWELTDRRRTFIVRSAHNRALGDGPSDATAAEKLHDAIRTRAAAATWELEIPARGGRARRTARLSVAWLGTVLRPPQVRKGNHPRVPVPITVVRVWEANPPAGVAPLEWLLLTNRPVATAEHARQVADYYACRWHIEEYHKAQKSGALIESCQFQSGKKVQALIAVLSVVSVMLMNLRVSARDPVRGMQPATAAVPAMWVAILERLKVRSRPLATVRDFYLHLAWLGGYMKDKPEREPPGWQTLWRGWQKFHTILQYHLSIPKM